MIFAGNIVKIKNKENYEGQIGTVLAFTGASFKEIISAVNDLKNSMIPIDNFLYHCMAIFKLKPKLILMNEPFMNIRGEILEKWLKVLTTLAKLHKIAILLETHPTISSFYADCQYLIRHKIVEIIEKVHVRHQQKDLFT
ncbi:hypothetical protein LCGC14_1393610 [marine sediment metagenome]|uniref:Uncharacterized protein n=1 Tax=marine sediment metagenome TaxID=412755 RepID=A0A0F9JZ79_9ZZZZ